MAYINPLDNHVIKNNIIDEVKSDLLKDTSFIHAIIATYLIKKQEEFLDSYVYQRKILIEKTNSFSESERTDYIKDAVKTFMREKLF